jgi:hypothetical protein
MSSKLDQIQIFQEVHDPSSQALQVKGIGGAFVTEAFDYVSAAYPSATQEVYTYKLGGAGGTTVATLTLNYTDGTKANIANVAKT